MSGTISTFYTGTSQSQSSAGQRVNKAVPNEVDSLTSGHPTSSFAASRYPAVASAMLNPVSVESSVLSVGSSPVPDSGQRTALALAGRGLLPRTSTGDETLAWADGFAEVLKCTGIAEKLSADATLAEFVEVTQPLLVRRTGEGVGRWLTPDNEQNLDDAYPLAQKTRSNLLQLERALGKMKAALPKWQLGESISPAAVVIHGGFGADLKKRAELAKNILKDFGPDTRCYYLTNPRPLFIDDPAERAMASEVIGRHKETDPSEIATAMCEIAAEHKATLKSILEGPVEQKKAARASMVEQRQANRQALAVYVAFVREKLSNKLSYDVSAFSGYASEATGHAFSGWPTPYDYLTGQLQSESFLYVVCAPPVQAPRLIANTADSIDALLRMLQHQPHLATAADRPLVFVSSGLTHRQHILAERKTWGHYAVCTIEPEAPNAPTGTTVLLREFGVLKELDSLARLAFGLNTDIG